MDDARSAVTPARDTIVALSTAPGRAAIAVIRASGPAAGPLLDAVAGARPDPRRAAYGAFRHPLTSELIDRGVALFFPGPASVTGEDVAELHVHGGRAVVTAMLDAALAAPGLRMAESGEFTRRAFLAGRMDLAEVEGLADLLAAETEAQRRQAISQSAGALSAIVDGWRERLIQTMALIEAGIDFSDEDGVPAEVRGRAKSELETLRSEISASLSDKRAERLRDGFRVAIVGRPNAGKSSLLNALARREAAIVTATPGTTRDVVEIFLDLDGLPVIVSDTAGLREAADEAEREGIRRATAQARAADLVLWVDAADEPAEPDMDDVAALWRVTNKIDLRASPAAGHAISTRTGEGVSALIADLREAAESALGSGHDVGLSRARHRDAVSAVSNIVNETLTGWASLPDELIAENLRRAAEELGRVTGRIGVEDVLGQIFGSFCIGK